MIQPIPLLLLLRIFIGTVAAYAFIRGFGNGASLLWHLLALSGFILGETAGAIIAGTRSANTESATVFGPMAASIARLTMLLVFVITGVIPWWVFVIFFYVDALNGLLRIFASALKQESAYRSRSLVIPVQMAAMIGVLILTLLNASGIPGMPDQIAGFHPGFWILLPPALMGVTASIKAFADPNGAIMIMMKPKK